MHTIRFGRLARVGAVLLAVVTFAAAWLVSGAASASTPAGPRAAAYGAYVSAHDIHVGPLGTTNWPAGPTHASIVDTHHDLVILGAGESDSSGQTGHPGSADSHALLGQAGIDLFMLNSLLPLPSILSLSASGVTSTCSYEHGHATGTSALGSADLTIEGKSISLPVNLPKNLNLSIPGLINIVVNKQTVDAHGNLQVTALWVESTPLWNTLTLGATIDIALAATSCGPSATIAVPGTGGM